MAFQLLLNLRDRLSASSAFPGDSTQRYTQMVAAARAEIAGAGVWARWANGMVGVGMTGNDGDIYVDEELADEAEWGNVDVTNPSITITSPTSAATFDNDDNDTIDLGGTASDNVGVTSVTWVCDTGG